MNTKKKRLSPLRFVQKYGRLILGITIIAVVVFCSVFAPLLTEHDPYQQDLLRAKELPSSEHIMGLDFFGRDIWSRILYGSRNTLLVAIVTQIVVTVVGTILGLLCGYFPKVEKYVMRFLDAYATIPGLLMNLMMLGALGSSVFTLILAMSLNNIPGVARAMRNQVLFVRNKEYIESSNAMGASHFRTMFHHVLPNISNYLWVRLGGGLAGSIGSMTALSYLGVGLDPTIPSWGGIVQDGQTLMFAYPHLSFFAIGVISITIFGFVMLGEGLRELLDPRLEAAAAGKQKRVKKEQKLVFDRENETVLDVKDLQLWFRNDYDDAVKILNGISFHINKGETLGIVGESGCGKSMTSLSVMQLLETPPAVIEGSVKLHGVDLQGLSEKQMQSIRGNEMSMIFQEPMTSLNPLYTIGDQLMESFRLHQGMNKKEAWEHSVEMMKMVRIPEPEQRMKELPYQLSGGMRQRIMIAMALACRPELLIADEPTTALDVTIQAQVLDLMRDLQKNLGTAIMFITHDLGVVSEMCDRVMVLYCGEQMEEADVDTIFADPKHPYTEGLLSTLPKFGERGLLPTIPGTVPPSGQFPQGCVFAPRCKYATDKCHACKPGLMDLGNGHRVRCFRYEEQEVSASE